MRKKKLNIPLYFGTITIIQSNNLNKLKEKYSMEFPIGTEGICFRNHKKNGYSRYIIAVNSPTTPQIIAHEALHLVSLIYEDRGIILDIENDEPQCYLLGWIVGECHKVLKIEN